MEGREEDLEVSGHAVFNGSIPWIVWSALAFF